MAYFVNLDPLGIWGSALQEFRWTAKELRTLQAAARILDKAGEQLPEPHAFECKRAWSALDELGAT